MGKGVWGIDISKYSIKAVRMEASATGLVITAADVFPYSQERVGDDADEQIRSTLEEMKAQLRIGGERVVLSLPSHSTFNRLFKLPPVNDAEIPRAVHYEAAQQIPFPIEEVIWDYQFVEREYSPGEEKEVILFAIKRDIVEQFLKGIEDVGLNVDAVQFSPVALYNFLIHDQDVTSTSVAIDMGGDNTDLVIIDGPKFWIRNLPLTGNDITKALQKAFSIPFNEAEKLKLKAAQSQQSQKIFNAIQPVLRDLVSEVHRSIGYYKSISKTIKFDKVILLGNSTKTFNFQKFVSQSLQMPAARVSKLNHIQLGGTVDQAQFNEDVGTLGTAIGLALQGHDQARNRINLLPPVYLKKKELRKKQPYLIGIVAALYLLVFSVWYTWDGEVQTLNAARDKARKAHAEAERLKGELNQARDYAGARKPPLDSLASISYERDLVLKVMNDIVPNIPKNGARAPEQKEADKIWILDWKFEEVPDLGPGAKPVAGAYVPEKKLKVTLEVAARREGRAFGTLSKLIAERLLGVPDANGTAAAKASVVKHFDLRLGDTSGMLFEVHPGREGPGVGPLDPSDPALTSYLQQSSQMRKLEEEERNSLRESERRKLIAKGEAPADNAGATDLKAVPERNDIFSRFEIRLEIPLRPETRASKRAPAAAGSEQPADDPKQPSGQRK